MRCGNERERTIWLFVIVKKQIDVSFSCVCLVIDDEFRHNIVKVVCGSTRLSPRGSTATLTMLWRNSWSITGQTHEKQTSKCAGLMVSGLSWLRILRSGLEPWLGIMCCVLGLDCQSSFSVHPSVWMGTRECNSGKEPCNRQASHPGGSS